MSHCSNITALEKQFRTLIKKYHPDKNDLDPNLANQKSHTIIQAYKKLKEILSSEPGQISNQNINIQNKKHSKRFERINSIAFFILYGNINYAIPVSRIQKIIYCDQKKTRNHSLLWVKKLYSTHCELKYEFMESIRWDEFKYLFLLSPESKKNALAIGDKIQMGNIKNIEINSASIYPCHDLSGVIIRQGNFTCFCPEDLAFNEFINCA